MEDRFDDIDVEDIKEQIKAYAEQVRPKDVKNRALIMNPEGDKAVKEIILKYSNILLKPEDIDKVIKRAYVRTTTDTHQQMEAVVHNLNSMHCLPASEKIWVYDTFEDEFKLIRMDDLDANFEINRYKVLQINKSSGKTEFRYITSSRKVGNGRTISTVVDKAGHTIRVTDNHRIMDIDSNGNIVENYPNDVKYLLQPRNIAFPTINNDICLQAYGRVRRDSPYFEDHIAITEQFAELMGYYMADGCILGKNGAIMCITACEKVSHEYLCQLVADVFGDRVTQSKTMYNNSKHGEQIKDSRFYIGSRLAKMIIDKFGRIGSEKKIPKEIMFSSPEIRSAFLRAYFICDGRSKTKYAEGSQVNKDLRDSIQLMIMSLGGYCQTNDRVIESPFNGKINNIHSVCMQNREARRVGINVEGSTSFEIPKYSLSIAGKVLGIDTGLRRKDNEVRYCELEDAQGNGDSRADKYLNFFQTPVKSVQNEITDENVYDISVEDNENFLTSSCIFVHNSRAGAQVPFSQLNFGTDTSYEGRLVIEQLLLSTDEGLGNGETPIFPVSVYKMKKGVSAKPGDPNYDLFELACKVSAKRLFPKQNWGLCDIA